jgi:hypothetical protein
VDWLIESLINYTFQRPENGTSSEMSTGCHSKVIVEYSCYYGISIYSTSIMLRTRKHVSDVY